MSAQEIPAAVFPKPRGIWAKRCAVEVETAADDLDEMVHEIPSPMRKRLPKKDIVCEEAQALSGSSPALSAVFPELKAGLIQLLEAQVHAKAQGFQAAVEADAKNSASEASEAEADACCYSKMTMLSLYDACPKQEKSITSIGAAPGLTLPAKAPGLTLPAEASVLALPAEESKAQEEMDNLLRETFFEALKQSAGDLPTPMKGSNLYTRYMRPCRPTGTSLEVKESSFKSLRGFLEHLEQEGFLSLSGSSDPVVTKIHWEKPELKALPKSEETVRASKSLCSLTQGTCLQPSWRAASTPSRASEQSDETQTPSSSGTPSKASEQSEETQTPSSSGNEGTKEEMPAFFPESASEEPFRTKSMKEVSTGDFVVATPWSYDGSLENWDDEVALSVDQDDLVYVSCFDAQGWAKAVTISGEAGWLPAAVLRRQIYVVMDAYTGGAGFVKVEQGDQLTIYYREGEWAYGASVGEDEQVLEEGCFPCSVVHCQSS
mmetsp:Transcript_103473/g.183810  ORF Transcript_103473/g.183810 Transcript_103473/m.183810 type:complete len:490 (+) Transcript_103473:69-1538(+)